MRRGGYTQSQPGLVTVHSMVAVYYLMWQLLRNAHTSGHHLLRLLQHTQILDGTMNVCSNMDMPWEMR